MTTAVATLPTGSDPNKWSEEEKALVSAAGLVHTDTNGTQTAAPRPVVAAFLQHCARTGLDPFARQIYAIARKNRGNLQWTTQISIDGARLVAERTGQYEGQTTPEFTADGITWTEVWLAAEPPKAARVGVHRRGFKAPLYAIALWEAYAVYQDEWVNGSKTGSQKLSAMWAKMGPLMLAKCAEMLALRKAFPQDLSGLYTTEEMQQAGGEPPAEPAATAVAEPPAVVEATIDDDPRDWAAEIEAVETFEQLSALYTEAQKIGALGNIAEPDPDEPVTVEAMLWARRRRLEAEPQPVVEVQPSPEKSRDWLAEAKATTGAPAVIALYREALALDADEKTLTALTDLAAERDTAEKSPPPAGEWSKGEAEPDGWEADDRPAVLTDEAPTEEPEAPGSEPAVSEKGKG
jgi:phage recombination protein Bet